MFRINSAFRKNQNGESATSAAYEVGYESLSGFSDSFKSVFGVSPKKGKTKNVIDIKRIETPLVTMYACAVKEGICLLEFTDRKMLETELKSLAKILNATIIQGENEHFNILELQLKEYFEGVRKVFTVPLFTSGSDFQKSVWKVLQDIPYGGIKSYKEQSVAIGEPRGS